MKRYLAIALLSSMSLGLPGLHACIEVTDTDDQQQQKPIVQDSKGASTADNSQSQAKADEKNANNSEQKPADGNAKG